MHHFYKFKYYFMRRHKTDYDFKWGPPSVPPHLPLCALRLPHLPQYGDLGVDHPLWWGLSTVGC